MVENLKFILVLLLWLINKIDLQIVNQTCEYGTVLANNVCSECGKTDVTPNIKIVGGQIANPNSWPAQALVIMSYKTDYLFSTISQTFQCGGTLINSRTILTAAHCIAKQFTNNGNTIIVRPNYYYPTWGSMFTVYLGSHAISSLNVAPSVKMSVSNVIIHPSYNSITEQNDIALLILSSPVTTSSAIKYACLPKEQSGSIPQTNRACYASGWGKLSETGSVSSVLYNVQLTIYDLNYCTSVVPSYPKDKNYQICAGDINGKKDTCQGDSGGGLYVKDDNLNKYIVVGVTSYGEGCARAGKPGIYTRVSNYIDWIKANWENSATWNSVSYFKIFACLIVAFFHSF